MTTTPDRQPAGIPAGGQFAPSLHDEPGLRLAGPVSARDRVLLNQIEAATRANMEHSSALIVASRMAQSPNDVYPGNAASIAAANGCRPEDIVNIDQVFNHNKYPLNVAPGAEGTVAYKLAAAGLAGSLAPYAGDNPDVGENPVLFTSQSGRELAISDDPEEGFRVTHEDRYDEDTFSLEVDPDDADPVTCAETVRDVLWQLAVTDANYEFPTGLSNGDFYELRDLELGTNQQGEVTAALIASNDDGMFTTVACNLETGQVDVLRDGDRLEGFAADMELAAVFEGLHSEPHNGDFTAHTATYFKNLLTTAATHEDAPGWATRTAARLEDTK